MFKSITLMGLLISLVPLFVFGQVKNDSSAVKVDSVSYSVKGMT